MGSEYTSLGIRDRLASRKSTLTPFSTQIGWGLGHLFGGESVTTSIGTQAGGKIGDYVQQNFSDWVQTADLMWNSSNWSSEGGNNFAEGMEEQGVTTDEFAAAVQSLPTVEVVAEAAGAADVALAGAETGAIVGGEAGSLIPGVGTIIGIVVGGL